jgi:hypothetical protein
MDGSDHTLLRVLHYPPLLGAEEPDAVRAAAHTDINLLTLLPAQWASTAIQTALTGTGTRAASSALLALGGTAATTLLVAALWPRRWPYLLMFTAWLGMSALVWQRPPMPHAHLASAGGWPTALAQAAASSATSLATSCSSADGANSETETTRSARLGAARNSPTDGHRRCP